MQPELSERYRGRFAPSPTGPLHFGSLFAAVISYLHARAHNGEWLLRIEDIDPPREVDGAKQAITGSLAAHGFRWDGTITYQSRRSAIYEQALSYLNNAEYTYYCPCSRKYLRQSHGVHMPACQQQDVSHLTCATKFLAAGKTFHWDDCFIGSQQRRLQEDFVLKRKDQLYAYQLAVVCDDLDQNISHVIRGNDLVESTPMQLALYAALGKRPPSFGHFPVIVGPGGQKLSKQNLATPIDNQCALENLRTVLALLQIELPRNINTPQEALDFALSAFSEDRLKSQTDFTLSQTQNG